MTLTEFLAIHTRAIIIDITATKGSAPRDPGTFMLVSTDTLWGTIGGGNMEHAAIEDARRMLLAGEATGQIRITLGPDSGQCCGGIVELKLTLADDAEVTRLKARLLRERQKFPDVFLFGAGHVGRALATALKPLPLRTVVVESRQEELNTLGSDIEARLAAMPESLVRSIRPGGAVVILTHDHALDFLIGAEALRRDDLAYVGMIGSKTKRGVFSNWLVREGFDHDLIEGLVLPVGGTKLKDKRPEVIAALVAAELLAALL